MKRKSASTKSIASPVKNRENIALPPKIKGDSLGHLFIEIGDLKWCEYDGINYLTSREHPLYIQMKFFGQDDAEKIFLKFKNKCAQGAQNANKYCYQLLTSEKVLEKYLDDMGVLLIQFYDTEKK